jgi:hypothetical protein
MKESNYPVPPSHKTFTFGNVVIDSNFDSGNCCNAEKVSNTNVKYFLLSITYGSALIIQRIIIEHGFTFP